ncbi:rhamnosyltransferase WsaF family glycosyltransferase [Paludibacterium paludis]|uniref:WsaF C-terminal domain-containing protein n=1 Tax=Paludibacterium paludis TaxID=1225769 RepID=A0A918P635_9NEIS|nr:hypothetical protein [Paludibacterium paludis]GGY29308.1 hypothetical protein GCM10011289_35430 [Paludibacterium paludis]
MAYAKGLEIAGYECLLYLEGVGADGLARSDVQRNFGYLFEQVHYGWDDIAPADLVIATIWYSARIVRDLPFSCRKAYLVQDREALFYPVGYEALMAEQSYRYGLIPITVGYWLKTELQKRHGVQAYALNFGVDEQIYRPLDDEQREQAVCFIYQPDKPRRCARLGIDALGIVKHHAPNTKIYLYGSHKSEARNVWFSHTHMGLISPKDCNRLYNRCSVGLCLSASNPSRVPFEMAAAGLPVVELWGDSMLYDFRESMGILCEPTPESIAEGVLTILKDSDSPVGARKGRQQPSVDEVQEFVTVINHVIEGATPSVEDVLRRYSNPMIKSSPETARLPVEVTCRVNAPGNASLNRLHPVLRKLLGWGARIVRTRLLN